MKETPKDWHLSQKARKGAFANGGLCYYARYSRINEEVKQGLDF